MRPRALSISAVLFATTLACRPVDQPPAETSNSDSSEESGLEQAADPSSTQLTAPLRCGCVLEGVGQCGEYVEIDGEFVELGLPASSELGSMPFCGKDGLRAELEGELENGRFLASHFAYVE